MILMGGNVHLNLGQFNTLMGPLKICHINVRCIFANLRKLDIIHSKLYVRTGFDIICNSETGWIYLSLILT